MSGMAIQKRIAARARCRFRTGKAETSHRATADLRRQPPSHDAFHSQPVIDRPITGVGYRATTRMLGGSRALSFYRQLASRRMEEEWMDSRIGGRCYDDREIQSGRACMNCLPDSVDPRWPKGGR